MIEIAVLAVLGFAAYRTTRFLVIDTLLETGRGKFHAFLFNRGDSKLGWVATKLLDLTSCTWCLGFWVSLVVYSVFVGDVPWDFTRLDWINTFAVAGVQGILHAVEPEE